MSHAKNQTSQEKISEFRMGSQKKHQKNDGKTSIKARLIRKAGGYGGFIRKYKKDPFTITREEAKRLIGRNEKCFCGSEKKYKKCCLK
jgi:uncharacterized protein YecA (UPF0149 family)